MSLFTCAQEKSSDSPPIGTALKSIRLILTAFVPSAESVVSFAEVIVLSSTSTYDFTSPMPTLNPMPTRFTLNGAISDFASDVIFTSPCPSAPVPSPRALISVLSMSTFASAYVFVAEPNVRKLPPYSSMRPKTAL